MKSFACLTVILLVAIVSTVGCASKDQSAFPPPSKPVIIERGSVGSEPACSCSDSFPYFVRNTDPDNAQTYSLMLEERHKVTGVITRTNLPLTRISPGGRDRVGCSVGPNPTESAPPNCILSKSYEVRSFGSARTTSGPLSALFGPEFQPSISSCTTACENPNNPYCLDLGIEGKKLTLPFQALVDAAWSKDKTVITNDELLRKYSVRPEDDSCKRGDTLVESGIATNKSTDGRGCVVTAKGGLGIRSEITSVSLYFRSELEARRIEGIRSPGSGTRDIEVREFTKGALLEFAGTGSDALNEDFAGEMRYVSISPKQTILVTSRGCLSVPR